VRGNGDAMEWSAYERFLFGSACVVLSTHLCFFLRFEWLLFVRKVCFGWRAVRQYVGGCFKRKADGDDMHRAQREEMTRQTTRKFVWLVILLRHSLALITGVLVLNLVRGRTRYMTVWQDLARLVLAGFALFLGCLPERILERYLDLWLSVCWFLGAIQTVTAPPDLEGSMLTTAMLISFSIVFTWAQSKLWVSILWNLLYSVLWLYSYNLRAGMTSFVFSLEVSILVSAILWSIAHHVEMVDAAGRVVQAQVLSGEVAAMKRLMNLACDVTVELDEDLYIVHPVPRLMAMLTLDPNLSAKGVALQQFMPSEEDRTRFERMLRSCGIAGEGMEPGVLHVTLRASGGTLLNVEIFYVRFYALGDRRRYFVGFREFSDEQPAQLAELGGQQPIAALGVVIGRSQRSSRRDGDHRDNKGSNRRGTPPAAPAAATLAHAVDAAAENASVASDSSGESSVVRPMKLLIPGCAITSSAAREFSLLMAIRTWNSPVLPFQCCPLHSALRELRASMRSLERSKCRPHFAPTADAQCEHCGILSLADDADEDEDEDEGNKLQYCYVCRALSIRLITTPLAKQSL